jgi:hypothetical protein
MEMKEQWLTSLHLARAKYINRHELESDAVQRQRTFLRGWMTNAVEIATEVVTAIEDDRVE